MQVNRHSVVGYQFSATGLTVVASGEYDEREAARFGGYNWEQYQALPGACWWMRDEGDCKALVIAHYRINNRLSSVSEDLRLKSIKRK